MIHEDPDELGYTWVPPEFYPPSHGGYPGRLRSEAKTMALLNEILSPREQESIERSAHYAFLGVEALAEANRYRGGYGRHYSEGEQA